MKFNKKEILLIILYTVCLIFGFVYIKEIFAAVKYIFNLFLPFLIGIAIAYVLNVLMNVIEFKWLKKVNWPHKRMISLLLALGLVISFLTLLLVMIVPNVQNTLEVLANNIPSYTQEIKSILEKLHIDSGVITNVSAILKDFGDNMSLYIKDNKDQIVAITLGIASNVLSGLINIIIAFVFAIYLLVQKERIMGQVKKVLKAYMPDKFVKKSESIWKLSNKVFTSFVTGQCLEACIIGILCFIGMIILRLPYATTISILVGFTALIPVFGAFIGTGLGAFLIFMVSPLEAVIFVLFIIVLQQFEGNLIYPKVVGKSVGLPGIWVFVAVTVGASINGVLGMLLSVPLVSILYSILAFNVNDRLNKKKNTA